jgi:hypothetical protein
MDYAWPSCKTTFTADQTDLMYATLLGPRASLWHPDNINNMGLSCCYHSAHFAGYYDACASDSVSLVAYSYPGASYTWSFYKNQQLYTLLSTTLPNVTLKLDSGLYDVALTIHVGGDTFSRRVNQAFLRAACDKLLPSTQGSWYFGDAAGIRFYENGLVFRDDGPFKRRTSYSGRTQIFSGEGTISMCDTNGSLLFYGGPDRTNSFRVFDADYKEMVGSPLEGNSTAVQGVAGIQAPKTDSSYYIIYQSGPGSTYKYALINLKNRNNTKGTIVWKDKWLVSGISPTSEGMTTIPSCHPDTSFLVIPRWIMNASNVRDTVISFYKICKDSIFSNPIDVNIELKATKFNALNQLHLAGIIFSPNLQYMSYNASLYKFDVVNLSLEHLESDTNPELNLVLDASFSPNSEMLYRSEITELSSIKKISNLVQYNIMQREIFKDGKIILSDTFSLPFGYNPRIGPNEKLYIRAGSIYEGTERLLEIGAPNEKERGQNQI